MSNDNQEFLLSWLENTLRCQPQGLSEHELLKRMISDEATASGWSNAFDNNHSLFRAHFLLFHLLYRLRNQLWQECSAHVEISPLKIQLLPYIQGQSGVGAYDELMDYYLDLNHLKKTTAEEVDDMLGAFFVRLNKNGKREEALAVLGLEDPVDDATIKKHYRRLAMEHHPDRGGEKERLQEINDAMSILARP